MHTAHVHVHPIMIPGNHPLADRPIFMDNNARPHRARIVRELRQQEARMELYWP